MNRILITTILIPLIALLTASCGKNSSNEPETPKTHRTVMVYMVADNSLGNSWKSDQADLAEMETAARNGDLNGGRLLVYHNRPGTANGNAPQLLEITATGTTVLKTYPDDPSLYSVTISRMREAITDMKKFAPAADYGLVLWSHANGWLENTSTDIDEDAVRKRAFGEDRTRTMKLTSLGRALEDEHFSFIYFDCCLMGTVEVAYQLRNSADVIVASPTELHIDGMPYDKNVAAFFTKGTPDMVKAATNTFEHYDNRTNGVQRMCQMVVVNTSSLSQLASASKAIYATLTDYPSSTGVQKYVRASSKCYIYDMAQHTRLMAASRPDLLTAWQQAFDKTVIYAATTPTAIGSGTIDTENYGGLGEFIVQTPTDITYRGYDNCAWWADVVSAAPIYQ